MTDSKDLVEAWIQYQSLPENAKDRDALFWAWEQVTDMCEEDPESAWNVIQDIILSDQSDKILASVG